MTAASTARILGTDAAVKREPFALGKPRIVRDTKIAGFHLWSASASNRFLSVRAPAVERQPGRTQIEWLGEHPHAKADDTRARRWPFKPRASAANTSGPLSRSPPTAVVLQPGLGAVQGRDQQRRPKPTHHRRLPGPVRSAPRRLA